MDQETFNAGFNDAVTDALTRIDKRIRLVNARIDRRITAIAAPNQLSGQDLAFVAREISDLGARKAELEAFKAELIVDFGITT